MLAKSVLFAEGLVRAGQQLLARGGGGLRPAAVLVAAVACERAVGLQPVGVHDRPARGGPGECEQRLPRRVREHGQTQPDRAASADLDRDAKERLLPALMAAFDLS
jgi:hypothetical protein